MYVTSLKDLQLNEVGRTNHTFKAVGAGFWAFKQKDFRTAIQDIVMEVVLSFFYQWILENENKVLQRYK